MTTLKINPVKKHAISPYLYMQFMEPLGVADASVDAGWDFVENDWYPKLIEAAQKLAPTMVRFGGCFASYYHWREAVGPQEKRIPMLNHCWGGKYFNQVGTHEVMDFCRRVGADPLLVVNMESDGVQKWANPKNDTCRLGTAEEAADWVDYCNNPDNAERIANGIEAPYQVKHWQIGNETSYTFRGDRGFTPDACYEVTCRFAEKMRAKDPSIKLIGWSDRDRSGTENWGEKMSRIDDLDMLAFHHHYGPGGDDSPLRGTEYRKDYDANWAYLMDSWKSLDEHIRMMRADTNGKKLAVTEGHYALPGRNRNEILSSWGVGVAYARCMNTFARHSDVVEIATLADFFGNVWQNNAILIPFPLIGGGSCYLQPVGAVMSLLRKHQGAYWLDSSHNGTIDAVCSATDDTIYIHATNTNMHAAQEIRLDLGGRRIKKAELFYIAEHPATEIMALNSDVFSVKTASIEGDSFTLPAAAVAAIELTLEPIVQ